MSDTKTDRAQVKVGDVFYRSWGYDQTQVNWAVVVGLTPSGKSARIQEIRGVTVQDDGPTTRVMPDPERKPLTRWTRSYDYDTNVYTTEEDVVTPVETKLIQWTTWRGEPEPYLAENSYSAWSYWDGSSQYATGAGWGH